jgi:hypothetical protein
MKVKDSPKMAETVSVIFSNWLSYFNNNMYSTYCNVLVHSM